MYRIWNQHPEFLLHCWNMTDTLRLSWIPIWPLSMYNENSEGLSRKWKLLILHILTNAFGCWMPCLVLSNKGCETLPEQDQGHRQGGMHTAMSPADMTPCCQDARVDEVRQWKLEAPNAENKAHTSEFIPYLQVGPSSGDSIWEAPIGASWTPSHWHQRFSTTGIISLDLPVCSCQPLSSTWKYKYPTGPTLF